MVHTLCCRKNLPPRIQHWFDPNRLIPALRERLDDDDQPLGRFNIAAQGQGGVGKTALATMYAYESAFNSDSPYRFVWWVHAETRTSTLQSLSEMVVCLISYHIDTDAPIVSTTALDMMQASREGSEVWISLLHGMLSETESPWLLVFDNYSRYAPIDDLIPPSMASEERRHHVLVTTRDTDVANVFQVPMWTQQQAQQYLKDVVFASYMDGPGHGAGVGRRRLLPALLAPVNAHECDRQVREVCRRVASLPLALAVVGQVIYRAWETQPEYQLTTLMQTWEQVPTLRSVPHGDVAMQRYAMDCVLLSAMATLQDQPVLQQRVDRVVSTIAFVAADDIPVHVLGFEQDAMDWLMQRHIVHKKEADDSYSVHRLTQDAAQRNVARRGRGCVSELVQASVLCIHSALECQDTATLRIHGAAAMTWAHKYAAEVPAYVQEGMQHLSLVHAAQTGDLTLLRGVFRSVPEAMVFRDGNGMNLFHHAFNARQLGVMDFLISEVPAFQTGNIAPCGHCRMERFQIRLTSTLQAKMLVRVLPALGDTLETLDLSQSLQVSHNIGILLPGLLRLYRLKILSLDRCGFTDHSMLFLVPIVRRLHGLESLQLAHNAVMSLHASRLMSLMAQGHPAGPLLLHQFLEDAGAPETNPVSDVNIDVAQVVQQGVHSLALVLECMPDVTHINLMNLRLSEHQLKPLAEAIAGMPMLKTTLLQAVEISSCAWETLGEALAKSPSLQTFIVAGHLSDVGAIQLLPHLAKAASLENLHLPGNPQMFPAHSKSLVESMTILVPHLARLDLSAGALCDVKMPMLAAVLKHARALSLLDLSWNSFREEGAYCLARVLPQMQSLQSLLINKHSIGNAGIKILLQACRTLPRLHCLELSSLYKGFIALESAVSLVHGLSALQRLRIGGWFVTHEAARLLVDLAAEMDSAFHVDMSDSVFPLSVLTILRADTELVSIATLPAV